MHWPTDHWPTDPLAHWFHSVLAATAAWNPSTCWDDDFFSPLSFCKAPRDNLGCSIFHLNEVKLRVKLASCWLEQTYSRICHASVVRKSFFPFYVGFSFLWKWQKNGWCFLTYVWKTPSPKLLPWCFPASVLTCPATLSLPLCVKPDLSSSLVVFRQPTPSSPLSFAWRSCPSLKVESSFYFNFFFPVSLLCQRCPINVFNLKCFPAWWGAAASQSSIKQMGK